MDSDKKTYDSELSLEHVILERDIMTMEEKDIPDTHLDR